MNKTAEIGNRIKKVLKDKRITQIKLAEHLYYGSNNWSMILNGRHSMSVETIGEIAEYLGVSCDYLINGKSFEGCHIENTELKRLLQLAAEEVHRPYPEYKYRFEIEAEKLLGGD